MKYRHLIGLFLCIFLSWGCGTSRLNSGDNLCTPGRGPAEAKVCPGIVDPSLEKPITQASDNGFSTTVPNNTFRLETKSYPTLTTSPETGLSFSRLEVLQQMPATALEFQKVIAVMIRSGKLMQSEREWTPAFDEYRIEAARKYALQSKYNIVDYRGTIGLTVAKPKSAHEPAQQIPMHDVVDENTGATWVEALNRALEEFGVLIEARTYAMIKRDNLYTKTELMSWLFNEIGEVTNQNNQDEKVIFTFGDEKSKHMYTRLGFEVLTAEQGFPPLFFKGSWWHAMRVSPNRFVKEVQKYRAPRVIRTPGEKILVHTPFNGLIWADGDEGVYFEEGQNNIFLTVAERTELEAGVWVKAGGTVSFDQGHVWEAIGVEGAKENSPVNLTEKISIKPDGVINWSNGEITYAGPTSKVAEFNKRRILIPKNSWLWYHDGSTSLQARLDSPRRIELGHANEITEEITFAADENSDRIAAIIKSRSYMRAGRRYLFSDSDDEDYPTFVQEIKKSLHDPNYH